MRTRQWLKRPKVYMKKNVKLVLAAAVLLAGACNGWPGTLPYQEARQKPEPYPTYTATAGHPVEFIAGHHRFMVLPTEVNLRTARTESVGMNAGVSVFSLAGDEAPFATLVARGADGRTHAVAAID